MAFSVTELLREQQRTGWPDLAGATLRGTLPVTDALLTESLLQLPPRRAATILGAAILPGELVRVDLEVGAAFLSKRLSPEIHLSGIHGLPGRPSVTATVPRTYGALLSRMLKGRSESSGISFDGSELTVELRGFIERRWGVEAAGLLSLVKRVDLHSEAGMLFVDFEVRIP